MLGRSDCNEGTPPAFSVSLAQMSPVSGHPGVPDNPLPPWARVTQSALKPIFDLRRYFSLLCHRGHLAHV